MLKMFDVQRVDVGCIGEMSLIECERNGGEVNYKPDSKAIKPTIRRIGRLNKWSMNMRL